MAVLVVVVNCVWPSFLFFWHVSSDKQNNPDDAAAAAADYEIVRAYI